ncbi:hypothetical protein D9611_008783 [Ephemerocybe angulata]|uniref:G-patch domain-containing protein n=1 Tax=Ephemerocybe angulata TaxID=980116 RepID=A0A8H5CEB1_9AGAR|nr:hypothetical protein D9611_008783 [Tulosesus angulatus]
MATVSFTIHSHYDPNDRERLERETGQIPSRDSGASPEAGPQEELKPEEQWRKEALQIYKRPSLASSAPKFVPAKVAGGEWDSFASTPTLASTLKGKPMSNVAGWYKNLTAISSASPSPTPGPSRPSSAPIPASDTSAAPKHHKLRTGKLDKNNWFIQNVISAASASAPSSTTHVPFSILAEPSPSSSSATPTPAPSLADILKRDPPPTTGEAKFRPPVWVAMDPRNKGFGMLQRSGWNEGEALGPYAARVAQKKADTDVSAILGGSDAESEDRGMGWKGKGKERAITVEYVQVPATKGAKGKKRMRAEDAFEDDEVVEMKMVEMVDLTLDSEDEEGGEVENGTSHAPSGSTQAVTRLEVKQEELDEQDLDEYNAELHTEASLHEAYPQGHGGTALLTPISTILKTDRLGIGLKPKLTSSAVTKGAYRVPVLKDTRRNQARIQSNSNSRSAKGFRVTNTQGVLDEIKRREAEEKRDREVWGRGRKGKERKRRREEVERKGLLAYMNE